MSAKYEFIDAQKAQYAIVKMCGWLGVSTSGFYEWRDRPASATARRRKRVAALIQWIYDDSDGTYGHRRVHAALARQGESTCVAAVSAELADLGFDPVEDGDGAVTTIAFARCPFLRLAEAFPELVCHLHRGVVEGMVEVLGGARVERFSTLADRDPCQVELATR